MTTPTGLWLSERELRAMSPAELQREAGRVWRARNVAGLGMTPEDYTQDSIDPDAGVNDLAGALDGELLLRSNNDNEIAVYLVGGEAVGVGDSNGLWLVSLGSYDEHELVSGLTIRTATTDDRARWEGCDRVLSDCNTSVPLYPEDDAAEAAREWQRATNSNGGPQWAVADEENGCEACWDALRVDLQSAGLPDPVNLHTFLVPADWIGRECPHDAPAHARTILLPVSEVRS